jgi:Fe-S oxidoreductase
MALADYQRDMEGCSRCSSCKWVPFNQVKSWRFAKNCPSVCNYNFHAYSGSGKMLMGLSMVHGRSELTEEVSEIVYKCQMCGACAAACKVYRDDIDLTDVLLELRADCVEQGQLIIEHMAMIDALKSEDNVLGEPKDERGDWAEGLAVKDINTESAEIIFHAGCRYSYDPELRAIARGTVGLLLAAGVDVGIAGKAESCCGGRAYEMGYRGDAKNFAEDMAARVKSSGAKTLVTPCADGYATFRYLYPKMGVELPCEVFHITQYIEKLISQKKLSLKKEVPLVVTYHDPCHLGRMSEPYQGEWQGDKLLRPMRLKRPGRNGIYDAPRKIITSVPGITFVEMERIREYSWCCGAGGGVLEAYPEFAASTARERIEEALATGAEALTTACPWCVNVFNEAVADMQTDLLIYDLTELVLRSAGVLEPAEA